MLHQFRICHTQNKKRAYPVCSINLSMWIWILFTSYASIYRPRSREIMHLVASVRLCPLKQESITNGQTYRHYLPALLSYAVDNYLQSLLTHQKGVHQLRYFLSLMRTPHVSRQLVLFYFRMWCTHERPEVPQPVYTLLTCKLVLITDTQISPHTGNSPPLLKT